MVTRRAPRRRAPKRPAKVDPYLIKDREQTARALAQRAANARAREEGRPLPYPNPWDEWDPTKLPRDPPPTEEQLYQSYLEFRKLCPLPPRKRYTI